MQHADVTLHFGLDEEYFEKSRVERLKRLRASVIPSVKMCKTGKVAEHFAKRGNASPFNSPFFLILPSKKQKACVEIVYSEEKRGWNNIERV